MRLACGPADFDLATHWKTSTERFRDSRRRFDATLRLDPRAADRVRTWRMTSPLSPESPPDEHGWITLRVHFEDEDQARFVVLGFGPRAEIVEPASLRTLVEADLASMAERINPRKTVRNDSDDAEQTPSQIDTDVTDASGLRTAGDRKPLSRR